MPKSLSPDTREGNPVIIEALGQNIISKGYRNHKNGRIIKYNLEKPFDEYSYDTVTPQWIETGRTDEIEWCDKIEEVTESYVTVSLGGADKRIFDLNTLAKK